MESAATGLSLAPQLPLWALAALVAATAAAMAYGLLMRADGVLWRTLAAALLLTALLDPQTVRELRQVLDDQVLVVVDDSPSQQLGERPAQTDAALETVTRGLDRMAAEGGLAYRVVHLSEKESSEPGTLLLGALEQVVSETDARRISAAIVLTDGQAHDAGAPPSWPVHVLVSGDERRRDRSITLLQAPSFGLVRTGIKVVYVVEDHGGASESVAPVELWVNGRMQRQLEAPVGTPSTVTVELPHAGPVAVELRTPAAADEVTSRNNQAIASVNGVRDRLRVLLVSHSPHPAARVWRNLLKTDPAVDLIHFTILRTLDRLSPVPEKELSLIEFPVQRLFIEEIDSFDLIVFDRYRRRQLMSDVYFSSIVEYVRNGGALLVALGGPSDPAPGLLQILLPDVAPVQPTGASLTAPYSVEPTELGRRHPLTRAVVDDLERAGPWYWQKELQVESGETLLTGAQGWPLLTTARVGDGRVGVLATDQAWLWSRGHGGGGPHGELFRRLAHWLMGEPELEEERLWLTNDGDGLVVSHQTLAESASDAELAAPDGKVVRVPLAEMRPGLWQGRLAADEAGIYRVKSGALEAIGLMGVHDILEHRNVTPSTEILRPFAEASGGSVRRIADGVPTLRRSNGSGDSWIGLPRRRTYAVSGIDLVRLLPAWAALAAALAALCLAWLAEAGRLRFRWQGAGSKRVQGDLHGKT